MTAAVSALDSGRERLLALRGAIYDVLGMAFGREPDAAQIEALREVVAVVGELAVAVDDESLAAAARRMAAAIARLDAGAIDHEHLAREFARIFLIGHGALAPYESVYRSADGLAMQEPRDETLAFYARFGVGCDEDCREPEDHLALQLAFMGWLCSTAQTAPGDGWRTYVAGQAEFLDSHLLSWVPDFSGDIDRIDPDGWYGALGGLLLALIETDRGVFVKSLIEFKPD